MEHNGPPQDADLHLSICRSFHSISLQEASAVLSWLYLFPGPHSFGLTKWLSVHHEVPNSKTDLLRMGMGPEQNWLVVWNMIFFEFPYIGNFIIPTDFHIFQRGRSRTTTKCLAMNSPATPRYQVRIAIRDSYRPLALVFQCSSCAGREGH